MSTSSTYDVAVIGLGAVGAATAEALVRRGLSVLGLDRFRPPHAHGSSHGETRMIREAYFEAPFYVPLVQRAFAAWRNLEARSGRSLLRQTGGILVGPPQCSLITGSRKSAQLHSLPYEELSHADIQGRFPALQPSREMIGILEPRAGYLHPEACVEAALSLAAGGGANLRFGEPLAEWKVEGEGVILRTPSARYACGRMLIAAGSWIDRLLPELRLPVSVERAVQFWFEPTPECRGDLSPGRCPVYAWEPEPDHIWYGFPCQPRGLKVGFHYGGETADPESVRRTVDTSEVERMRSVLQRYMPSAAGRLRETEVCLYTNTPDRHFLIDFHPEHNQVLFAGGCSGHGFKFTSALGESLADLLADGHTETNLEPFRLNRFQRF